MGRCEAKLCATWYYFQKPLLDLGGRKTRGKKLQAESLQENH